MGDSGIYTYSFALQPEAYQPSGSYNGSRIDTVSLGLTISKIPVVWSRKNHHRFEPEHRQAIATFLLAMRRLEAKGTAPRLPPEMREKILELGPAADVSPFQGAKILEPAPSTYFTQSHQGAMKAICWLWS